MIVDAENSVNESSDQQQPRRIGADRGPLAGHERHERRADDRSPQASCRRSRRSRRRRPSRIPSLPRPRAAKLAAAQPLKKLHVNRPRRNLDRSPDSRSFRPRRTTSSRNSVSERSELAPPTDVKHRSGEFDRWPNEARVAGRYRTASCAQPLEATRSTANRLEKYGCMTVRAHAAAGVNPHNPSIFRQIAGLSVPIAKNLRQNWK